MYHMYMLNLVGGYIFVLLIYCRLLNLKVVRRCIVCIYLNFDVDCVACTVGLLVITQTSVQPRTLICLREYSGAKLR